MRPGGAEKQYFMKPRLFFLLAFLFSTIAVFGQNVVRLLLAPRLGASPFALNTPVSAGSYSYKIKRLDYYVSDIRIGHDGGQQTPVSGLYLLVHAAADSLFDLGNFPDIHQVESVTFSIGVDSAHNHLDPAMYNAKNPLAPQNPSMHWGWTAGYRFVAFEGAAGNNYANDFEIHAFGDDLYKTLTLSTQAEQEPNGDKTIRLIADYAQVLKDINVAGGIIIHSSTDLPAVGMMDNMESAVFSAQTTSIRLPAFEGTFRLSPNPATSDNIAVDLGLPAGSDYRIRLCALTGRTLADRPVNAGQSRIMLDQSLEPGAYLVHLLQNGRPVAIRKLIVLQ